MNKFSWDPDLATHAPVTTGHWEPVHGSGLAPPWSHDRTRKNTRQGSEVLVVAGWAPTTGPTDFRKGGGAIFKETVLILSLCGHYH